MEVVRVRVAVVTAPLLAPPRRAERAVADLASLLESHGDAPALLSGDAVLSHADLAARVRDAARRLGPVRRLVLLPAAPDEGTVAVLLGALAGGHPVLLAPRETPAAVAALLDAYDPDVVVRPGGALSERRAGTGHDLHPDLALLLSTSGSTGSPKLVRLTARGLWSNAEAIGDFLGLQADDRAVTTLPLAYCYGLSVLTSHLLRGASVVLTSSSVTEPGLWDLVQRTGVTGLAGVPYTFDLLERGGFAARELPSLRRLTQAGGRLAPEKVRAFAALGRARGWDLVVMYGQTEATARMAWLPPHLALERPEAVGIPVPGSSLEVDAPDDDGVGELVFRGPGVMMGYAETPADLALPAGPPVLRTGDLGRQADDGLFEVVGRLRPFAKVFGLRVDLGRVEAALTGRGLTAACLEVDGRLCVAVEGDASPGDVRRCAAAACGLPARAVRARCVPALPRRSNGKVDVPAVQALLAEEPPPAAPRGATPVHAALAEVLDLAEVADDATFVGLGGDSLSYVEASVRLEALLGEAPDGWHTTPVGELAALLDRAAPSDRQGRPVETSLLLRAVSIVLVVGSHAGLFTVLGGAHVLLAVAGWNAARFPLAAPRAEIPRRLLRSALRIWAPTGAWVAGVLLLGGAGYAGTSVLPLTGVLGPPRLGPAWRLWFLEVLVTLSVALVVLAVPAVDRVRRRAPFGTACAALGGALLLRPDLLGPQVPPSLVAVSTTSVAWLFALGWAGAEARTAAQRLAVSAVGVLAVAGWFGDAPREAVVVAGLLALLWVPRVRVPALVSRTAGLLAASSLYVYVTHWQVFPHLQDVSPALATAASFAVGLLWMRVCQLASRWVVTAMRSDARGTPAV